jgi:hypothetical protein
MRDCQQQRPPLLCTWCTLLLKCPIGGRCAVMFACSCTSNGLPLLDASVMCSASSTQCNRLCSHDARIMDVSAAVDVDAVRVRHRGCCILAEVCKLQSLCTCYCNSAHVSAVRLLTVMLHFINAHASAVSTLPVYLYAVL